MAPHFSVVISVYQKDNAVHFREALDSIIQQSVMPSEIIIVVDGPIDDDINGVLHAFSEDTRVNVIRLENSQGRGAARHRAIQSCNNDLVALMDSDDLSVPKRFELQLKEFNKRSVDVVGGQIEEFTAVPGDLQRFRRVPLSDSEIKKRNRWRQGVNHVTIMFKRESYIRSGGYRSLVKVEDWDLLHRMIMCGTHFKNIPETLVHVRSSDEQFQRRKGMIYIKEELQILSEMLLSGYINFLQFVINCSIRCVTRLLPDRLIVSVYKILLR